MPSETRQAFWQRSFTGKVCRFFFRKGCRIGNMCRVFFCRINWPRLGLILLSLIIAISLFYGFADWNGSRQWNAYRRYHEKTIGSLSLDSYFPPPVPDKENFAATPVVAAWCTDQHGTNLLENDHFSAAEYFPSLIKNNEHLTDLVDWRNRLDGVSHLRPAQITDAGRNHRIFHAKETRATVNHFVYDPKTLKLNQSAAQRMIAAPKILESLVDDQPLFAQLSVARSKPFSRYPELCDRDHTWTNRWSYLSHIPPIIARLQLQAAAEVVLDQTQKADYDIELIFYLANSIRSDPFFSPYFSRINWLRAGLKPIWEGLAQDKWSDAQLQLWQKELGKYNLLEDLRQPLVAEEAEFINWEKAFESNPLSFITNDYEEHTWRDDLAKWYVRLAPSGWYKLELLHRIQGNDLLYAGVENQKDPKLTVSQLKNYYAQCQKIAFDLTDWGVILSHKILLKVNFEQGDMIARSSVVAQVNIDEALIACALERYRLSNGNFPETLSQLIPQYAAQLPSDPMTDSNYRYNLKPNGSFVLYSVGWDKQYSRGLTKKSFLDHQSDWVWEYPTGINL